MGIGIVLRAGLGRLRMGCWVWVFLGDIVSLYIPGAIYCPSVLARRVHCSAFYGCCMEHAHAFPSIYPALHIWSMRMCIPMRGASALNAYCSNRDGRCRFDFSGAVGLRTPSIAHPCLIALQLGKHYPVWSHNPKQTKFSTAKSRSPARSPGAVSSPPCRGTEQLCQIG